MPEVHDLVLAVFDRGTSLVKNTPPVGPYSSPMPRVYGDPAGAGVSYERGTPVCGIFARQRAFKFSALKIPQVHMER